MTSYSTQVIAGTGTTALLGKDKGDLSNRLNCAGEQIKNNVKTLASDVVVIGGTAAGIAATKNGGIAKFFAKPVEALAKTLSQMTKFVKDGKPTIILNDLKTGKNTIVMPTFKKVPTVFSKLGNIIKNLPTRYKAAGFIATIGAIALGHVTNKHFYNAGQIDQKYTDKAKLKARANEIV